MNVHFIKMTKLSRGKTQKNKVGLLKEQYLNNNIFLSTVLKDLNSHLHEGQDVYSVII